MISSVTDMSKPILPSQRHCVPFDMHKINDLLKNEEKIDDAKRAEEEKNRPKIEIDIQNNADIYKIGFGYDEGLSQERIRNGHLDILV